MRDINEIRKEVLIEAAELLARTSPKEQTFNDTYMYAVYKLVKMAENIQEDIDKQANIK